MRHPSKKQLDAEKFVDGHIAKHGVPPTYAMIGKMFNLDKSASYARCRSFRHKMKQNGDPVRIQIKEGVTAIKVTWRVPASKFNEVTELITKIEKLLKS